MKTFVKVKGLKELEKALLQLKTATAKRIVRRILVDALGPVADRAVALAPDDPSTQSKDLKAGIGVGTQLTKRQRRTRNRALRNAGTPTVEAYVGVGQEPFYGFMQEFGTVKFGAQPFMRPAWDAEKHGIIPKIVEDTWSEIEKIAKREAAKTAHLVVKR